VPLAVGVLIAVGVVAFTVAAWTYLVRRERAAVLSRAAGDVPRRTPDVPILGARQPGLREQLLEHLPTRWSEDTKVQDQLIQAGYESPMAPLIYSTIRLALLVLLPVSTLLIMLPPTVPQMVLAATVAVVVAWILPTWYLMRTVRLRQEKIRRSLPDGLDLLVVCVEAGISLDAAILRVAKELHLAHPDLAHEFMVVNRKTNAGMTREEALRGLWQRTGVEELRALVSSMVQSERWGTSISNVLRVYAETLRRKRRQIAEKKAAVAPLKMLVPMVLFILPALFIVVLGPAGMRILAFFSEQARQ
jgi:tight adherence protein C